MNFITLDFETYFDKRTGYHLRAQGMTTEGYIRDNRFDPLGCAVKWGTHERARWFNKHELKAVFEKIDWANTAVLCHHSHFDGLILSHHFDIHPGFYLCTLSMGRLLVGNHLSLGLDSLAQHFGLGAKTLPYHLFEGRHWDDITADVQEQVGAGACDDVELTFALFHKLRPFMPAEELEVVDLTVKMFTEPVLQGDLPMLRQIWMDEAARKSTNLAALGITTDLVQSAAMFAGLLKAEGVEIEYKSGKHGLIPCFAKTDDFMRELLEDENPRVRALAAARIDERSTIDQTRAERLGRMAARGNLAVYLKYSGAHTTRWAGGDKVNWQNFPNRGDQRIRKAIHVRGTGHYIFAPDLSQIECRILNYIAGQNDVIEKFRNHVDPYIGIASDFYGFPVTKDHPLERGTGKQLELSAGYGCGAARCQIVAKLGIYGPPVEISLSEAQRAIDLYRGTHKHVTALWEAGSWVLRLLANGQEMPGWDLVPVRVSDGCVWLPNGAPLIYDTMEWFIDEQNEDRYWRVKTKHGGWTKMYGAKFIENIVQALARVVMSQAMVRLARAGFRPVNTEHDKLVYLIKDDGGKQEAVDYCLREMTRAPDWLPGIPLDAEGQLAETYAA